MTYRSVRADGFFCIADRDVFERAILATPAGGGLFRTRGDSFTDVVCGILPGDVEVDEAPLTAAPETLDESWDAVAEVSLLSESGDLRVLHWDSSGGVEATDLAPAGPGWYRIRAHVRGRSDQTPTADGSHVEQYLVLSWAEDAPRQSSLLVGPDALGERVMRAGPI